MLALDLELAFSVPLCGFVVVECFVCLVGIVGGALVVNSEKGI